MKLSILFLLSIFTGVVLLPSTSADHATGFLNRILKTDAGESRYQVYVPSDWNRRSKWPVVLFLHGAGERGDDGLVQTEIGIGTAIRKFSTRFPCVVVFPQCRKTLFWSQSEMEKVAIKALDLTIKEFNCDTNRVYLTGISMGGYGSWSIARHYPARFAAIAPICGGVRPPGTIKNAPQPEVDDSNDPYLTVARKVGTIPVWIFHGAADPAVPVTESRKMSDALKSTGGDVKYTEYEGVGHNSWDKAYADPAFPEWLLSKKLRN